VKQVDCVSIIDVKLMYLSLMKYI